MRYFDEQAFQLSVNRRTFLGRAAYGLGGIALACLLPPAAGQTLSQAPKAKRWTGIINPPHFPPHARRVIHLCMAGGPSHLESFDHKPQLKDLDGKPFPES